MPKGNPLQYAVDAEASLEKLATSLSQLGAGEAVVDAVEQMAEVTRRIVKELGKGQEMTGDDEPPEEEEEPAPEEEPAQPRTIGEATDQLAAEASGRAPQR